MIHFIHVASVVMYTLSLLILFIYFSSFFLDKLPKNMPILLIFLKTQLLVLLFFFYCFILYFVYFCPMLHYLLLYSHLGFLCYSAYLRCNVSLLHCEVSSLLMQAFITVNFALRVTFSISCKV